jgi:hypothetical protein
MLDANPRDSDRVWELMKKIGFAMLVSHDGSTPPDLGDHRKVAI